LNDKVAFITGVARGQGRSHAVRLAEEGVDIVGVDVLEPEPTVGYAMASQQDMDETIALVEKTGRRMLGIKADVRDRPALCAAAAQAVAQFGRLDIVSANAGIMTPGAPAWEMPPEEWDATIGTNLTGVFNTVAATVPPILEAGNGGSIVLTSSGAALRYVPNSAEYNASKAGVVAIAKTLANELAPHQIRVNTLAPGTVYTPMVTENFKMLARFRPDLESPTLDDTTPLFTMFSPLGRPWIDPVNVSDALVFLASDEARWITGVVLSVDQGAANRP
jgi:(+)-trans-carveol dehydrogenase